MPTNNHPAKTLFQNLYENCESGLVEFRPLPPPGADFFPLSLTDGDTWPLVDRLMVQHRKKNIYFGVGTRDGNGGAKTNVLEIPAVWIDIDFKDTPQSELKDRLGEFPFRPSLAVHSGGGYHLYWILQEPAVKEDFDTVESVNRRIANALGGDMASVDAARILRVPGTMNHKRGRLAELKHIANFRYNLDDFESLPEPAPQTNHSAGPEGPRKTVTAVFTCRFMRWAFRNQADVPEPLWYSMLTNIARVSPGGIDLCHRFSEKHPGYSRSECDRKILRALNAGGPHSCTYIRSNGFSGCRHCRGRSPLGRILKMLKVARLVS